MKYFKPIINYFFNNYYMVRHLNDKEKFYVTTYTYLFLHLLAYTLHNYFRIMVWYLNS